MSDKSTALLAIFEEGRAARERHIDIFDNPYNVTDDSHLSASMMWVRGYVSAETGRSLDELLAEDARQRDADLIEWVERSRRRAEACGFPWPERRAA